MLNKKVFILTWCNSLDKLYGSLLVFNTLRVGFPTADVFVIDNCSIESAVPYIESAAVNVNAKFFSLRNEVNHYDHIRNIIFSCDENDKIFIIDPDVIFWDNVEIFDTEKAIAGRLIPEFFDEYTNTITKARIHTSFLYLSNVKRIKDCIINTKKKYFESDLIRPVMVKDGKKWLRWDTVGQLYENIVDDCEIFDDVMNDKFDHIFCGSHLDIIVDKWNFDKLVEIHELAKRNQRLLKGIWREQNEFFISKGLKNEENQDGEEGRQGNVRV